MEDNTSEVGVSPQATEQKEVVEIETNAAEVDDVEEVETNAVEVDDAQSSSDSDGDESSTTEEEIENTEVGDVSSCGIDNEVIENTDSPEASEAIDNAVHEEKNTSESVTRTDKDKDTTSLVSVKVSPPDQEKDSTNGVTDENTDLSSPPQTPITPITAAEERIHDRLRAMSSISNSDDEFSDRPESWYSSSSGGFSHQSGSKRSVWSGSSMRSESSYAPSDHSDVELDPEENVRIRIPHRGRTTIRVKDEPQDAQEKRKKKAFHIVKEIMTTEETFVKVLRLLNESYRTAILRAGNALGRPVLPLEVLANILKYLPELQNLNEDLLKDFELRVKEWESNPAIADVFLKKGPFLKLYISYISEYEKLTTALDDARKKFPDFDMLTKAFEGSPTCKSLALKHYMLKPVQRLPQYRLLLQDYLKQLNEDSEEYKRTKEALAVVSEVADHANENMKFSDEMKRLWDIQNNLLGQFEVIKPGRRLIKSGMLKKLSRKVMQHRMFYLFTDVLLYTTPVATGYKLNNVFPLISLKVSRPQREDFKNEFSIISTQRSFTISASTPEERDDWLITIQDAVENDISKRQTFDGGKSTTPRKQIKSVLLTDKERTTSFKIGSEAPVWIPDDRVTMCMLCSEEFTITFRRHHCRACGKIVCGYCSDNKAPLAYLDNKAVRVCVACFQPLLNEAIRKKEGRLQSSFKNVPSVTSPAALIAKFKGFNWGSYRNTKAATRPKALHEVKASDEDATMSGYLKIWKGYKWKKRWFVIKSNVLYTFKAPEDIAAIDSVALLGLVVRTFKSLKELEHVTFEGLTPELIFELIHKGTTPMTFRAESLSSKEHWVTALQQETKA